MFICMALKIGTLDQINNAYSNYLVEKKNNELELLRGKNPIKFKEISLLIKGLIEEIKIALKNRDNLEEEIFNIKDDKKKKYYIKLLNSLLNWEKLLKEDQKLLKASA